YRDQLDQFFENGRAVEPESPRRHKSPDDDAQSHTPLVKELNRQRTYFGSHSKAADKIAVVGMACHFPEAPDIKRFWTNLHEGRDCIREAPSARWEVDQYFSLSEYAAGKSICKWGGFLDEIELFDPSYFGIPESLAATIDPLTRQWLEVSVE